MKDMMIISNHKKK